MDIIISVRKNTIYIDYGYIYIGDLIELREEISKVIKNIEKPFQIINIFSRSVEKHWLPFEEELKSMNQLSQYVSSKGRDLTVWVLPKQSLLFKSFREIFKPEIFKEIADTVEEAEEKIKCWKGLSKERTLQGSAK